MKMKKKITIEWEIHDTRNMFGGYRTGTSTIIFVSDKRTKDAINQVINFANNIPSWEFERNNIDLEAYREGNTCTYHYMTMLSKIISIEVVK